MRANPHFSPDTVARCRRSCPGKEESAIRPEPCFLHGEDRIGVSDAVQGQTFRTCRAVAGFCEKCGLALTPGTPLYPSHDCRSPLSPLNLPPHELLPELPLRSEKIVPSAENSKVFLAVRPSLPDWIDVVDLEPSPGRASHTAGSPELTLIVRTFQLTLPH